MRTLDDFSFTEEPGKSLEKPLQSNNVNSPAHIPAISVITPYFNSDMHLEQTFNCVMNQTFTDFEWMIVNDGSNRPEAVEILQRLSERDTRIRVIHQENSGQSVAKNHGIRCSRAKIIIFLDADDLIEKYYFEILYRALEEHPGAAWSYTDLVGFGTWRYIWCKPFSAGRMTFNNTLVNSAAFRKTALESVNCFSEEYKHYDEDWALYLKLLGEGYHPVHVPVIGFWYRRSDTGMQQTVRKNDTLRSKSDAYMAQLSRNVDIHIRGEEYQGIIPEEAIRTNYSRQERILARLLSHRIGVEIISMIYRKKGK